MTTIADLANDLLTKVSTTSIGNNVGIAAGAKGNDPSMRKATKPSAWIVYTGSQNNATTTFPNCNTPVINRFAIITIVAYGTQTEMLSTNYPYLDEVVDAIHNVASDITGFGESWNWDSTTLDSIDKDRLVYNINVSIISQKS